MNLIGRNILILGGNGFLGNYFGSRLVQMKANVMSLSRSQTKYEYPENNVIHWLRGSVLDPEALKPEINRADTIIHTIGTLFDTSVTKRTQPGGQGTYQQMNRDTLASIMSVLDEPKKIIYISSGGHPPFLKRYLDAKHEAQELLFTSKHEGYSLRPGFIYSWEHRKWSVPLKWQIDLWNGIYPVFQKLVPEKSKMREYLTEFKQAQNVALEDLGDAIIEICMHGSRNKVNQVVDIKTLCEKFRNEQRI